jgi:uncharacterized membrane protein YagU involved in acid resistance
MVKVAPERMKPNLTRAFLGGLVGTAALTLMMYKVAPMMTGKPMDIAGMLGQMLGGWTIGMVMHVINGTVIFPLAYALLLHRFLPGPPVVKGMVWGVILWLIAQLTVLPMMGAGVFSMNAGGPKAAMASLIGHLVYGALLGSIAREDLGAPAQAPPPAQF